MKNCIEQQYDLRVPFEQKEQAKAMGAKWDAMRRTWWATLRAIDAEPRLGYWLPDCALRAKCMQALEWLEKAEGDGRLPAMPDWRKYTSERR
jgi:hypothetical protein